MTAKDSPTVLLIDDDPTFRDMVKTWLAKAGYQPLTCESAEGCHQILNGGANPAVIILDVGLGDQDGVALLRFIRTRVSAPVVMLTGDTDLSTVVRAMRSGASDYITKPVTENQLLGRVQAQISQGKGNPTTAGVDSPSSLMQDLYRRTGLVAATDMTVLILGETGTGKEMLARRIHQLSPRANKPFVAINCAAIAESLQDSELFGHERGAFTGSISRRIGRFEQAHGGTLFLDEVGELSPNLQSRLLRVLQERSFFRVGGNQEVSVDVRLIAATHRDLKAAVKERSFREDLYFRLCAFEVKVPPLRDRREDIPVFLEHFRAELYDRYRNPGFSNEAISRLIYYDWPGNVREVRNAVERACILGAGRQIEAEDLPDVVHPEQPTRETEALNPTEIVERTLWMRTLEETQGNVSEAIRRLGVPRTTFYRKLRRYGIS